MSDDTPTNKAANPQDEDQAEFALSPEEEIFVNYLFEANMNRTRAYMRLYPNSSYDSARASTSRLLAKPKIKKEVARRLDKAGNVSNVIRRIALCPDESGYIYLITSDSGPTKIGYSKNPHNRFMQINIDNPSHLTLHHFRWVKRALDLESALHEKFAHVCVKGEWFNLSSEDLVETARMIDSYE